MSSNGFNPTYNNTFLLIEFYNPVSEQIKFPKFSNRKKILSFHFQISSVGKILKIQILEPVDKNTRGCSKNLI